MLGWKFETITLASIHRTKTLMVKNNLYFIFPVGWKAFPIYLASFYFSPTQTQSTCFTDIVTYICCLIVINHECILTCHNWLVWTITGTTKIKNLDQNIGALSVKLTEKDLREISEAVPIDDIAGTRHYDEGHAQVSWKFANTPPKDPSLSTWSTRNTFALGIAQIYELRATRLTKANTSKGCNKLITAQVKSSMGVKVCIIIARVKSLWLAG